MFQRVGGKRTWKGKRNSIANVGERGSEKIGELEEARRLEEEREPEEIRRLEQTGGLGEPELAAKRLEEARRLGEQKPAIGGLEEAKRPGKPALALLLSYSNCWQAFVLVTTCFNYCFSFLNYLVLS